VGKDAGAQYAPFGKGNKYNISPVRREFLSDLCAYICLDENPELEQRVRDGLAGLYNTVRYGIPFLGDNNSMIDILQEEVERKPAYWYEKITEHNERRPRSETTRLALIIDRQNMARTISALFSPSSGQTLAIPENAWVTTPT
jgi:CRISPR-associated protein Cas5t